MNWFIEMFAELVDAVGGVLAIIPNLVLDLGSYLHMMAVVIQHRNDNINDEEE